jgi:hypothetical protein
MARSTVLAGLVLVTATLLVVATSQFAGPSLAFASAVSRVGLPLFGLESPAVANLDRDLRVALRQAAADAAKDGVQIVINSGWRSTQYQEQLLRQAISKYGSKEKAARWVATPDTSPHVSGHAIDIGPTRAMTWLSRHGAKYHLCQTYRNEPWHFELRRNAPGRHAIGCPAMYADPRYDPRMQQ